MYDEQESQAEEMSCKQIEHDMLTASEMITATDLYCMAMESETAYRLMPKLCKQLCISLDQVKQPFDEDGNIKRDLMPDPFQEKSTV